MTVEHYRLLFEHNAWANNRVVEQIAIVGYQARLQLAGLDLGNGSILETVVHMLGTEETWLARCQGGTGPPLMTIEDAGTIAAIGERFKAQALKWQAMLGRLTDAGLDAISTNTSPASGKVFSHPLWTRLSHVLSHSTQHRGELALATTRLGHSPGELDFLEYYEFHR